MKKKRKKVKRLTLLFLSGFLMSFMLVAGILSAAAALFSQAEAVWEIKQEIPRRGLTPSPPR